MERLARDKHASLFGPFVNYGRKKIYNASPGPNVIKLFLYIINKFSYQARVFVIIGGKNLPGTNTLTY